MVLVPHSTTVVQEVHWDPGLPVSRLCCQLPVVCNWVAVAWTVRHFHRNSIIPGFASYAEDGASIA